MKSRPQLALGLAAGYLLGRNRSSLSDNLHSQAEALQHPADLTEDMSGRAHDAGRRVTDMTRRAPAELEELE